MARKPKTKKDTRTPFEAFYEDVFLPGLDSVGDEAVFTAPGLTIADGSWDRKAAYLLWVEKGRP